MCRPKSQYGLKIQEGFKCSSFSGCLGLCSAVGTEALLPLSVSSPGESSGKAGRNELPLLPQQLCLIILQKQSRRAGSIPAPVEVCSGVYPAKLFSPLPCYPSPIASPCHVWGLGFCIFVNKLKIHSGIQILLNDVWVAS